MIRNSGYQRYAPTPELGTKNPTPISNKVENDVNLEDPTKWTGCYNTSEFVVLPKQKIKKFKIDKTDKMGYKKIINNNSPSSLNNSRNGWMNLPNNSGTF